MFAAVNMCHQLTAVCTVIVLFSLEFVAGNENIFTFLFNGWRYGDNGQVLWRFDCDFHGYDLLNGSVQVSSENCGQACLHHPECTHFSHWHNQCYLKNVPKWTVHTNTPTEWSGICGFKSSLYFNVSLDGQVHENGDCDYPGNNFANISLLTNEDCSKACLNNNRCSHYSRDRDGNCQLKDIAVWDIPEDDRNFLY